MEVDELGACFPNRGLDQQVGVFIPDDFPE
jgi:hypothetical protein